MKRLIRMLLVASTLPLMSVGAEADSACDKPRNDFDGLYCLNKVYQQSDKDLNVAFSELRVKLDAAGQSALRTSQIDWLRIRDQSCSRHEGTGFYINLDCATKITISRTQFLEDRYRECISSGCRDSQIR